MLPFTIEFKDGVPVSDQLELAVRKAILTGRLVKGQEFPSVRTLSQELRISPTTAHKVVAELKEKGYLASRPGIGMVILAPDLPSREARMASMLPAFQNLLKEGQEMNLELTDLMEILRQAHAKMNPKK